MNSENPKKKVQVVYDDKTQAITVRSASGYSITYRPDGITVFQEPTSTGFRIRIYTKD